MVVVRQPDQPAIECELMGPAIISAKEALSHAYFAEEPPPKPHHLMPTFPSTHSSKARR